MVYQVSSDLVWEVTGLSIFTGEETGLAREGFNITVGGVEPGLDPVS